MPRTPRKQQWTEEACYHVMNRGHNRERIFGDDDDRRHFLGLLARYRERFGLRLYHYCLMTNHFHVLVQLERPADLSKWLSGMLRPTSTTSIGAIASWATSGRVVSRVRPSNARDIS